MRASRVAPFALALAAGWLVSNVGAVAGSMADAYGVSLGFVGVIAAAAVASHAVMQLPAGRIVDRYGARAAALTGLAILAAADGAGAAVPSPALAIATRLVVGVGTALCFVSGSDLLRAGRAPALAQGLYGGIAMAGAGLALALLPQVGHHAAWRAGWLSAAGVAIAGLVVVGAATRPASPRARARPGGDGPGRSLVRLTVLYAASYGSSVLVGNWVVTFLERAADWSSARAGAVGALTLFGGIVSRPFGGWIAEHRPELTRAVVAGGLAAGAAGTAALATAPPLAGAIAAAAAVGIGAGIPFGPVFSGAQRFRPDRPAEAVGVVNFFANTVLVAGVPLVGLTFSLPGNGRIGLVAVAILWAAALLALPPASALSAVRSSRARRARP